MAGGVVSRAHGPLGRGGVVPQEPRVPCLTRTVISLSQRKTSGDRICLLPSWYRVLERGSKWAEVAEQGHRSEGGSHHGSGVPG